MPPHLSLILPVRNEAERLPALLTALQPARQRGAELIVVDGESRDSSAALAQAHCDYLLHSAPGRARQMNLGAAAAHSPILAFIHADTTLPADFDQRILSMINHGAQWGRFRARLEEATGLLRIVEILMEWRTCLSGIATGDQLIFVTQRTFDALGGYPDIALMEDVELSHRLKRRLGHPALAGTVTTSSRRWVRDGVVRTIVLMWWLRLAYAFGADPNRLAARYYSRWSHVNRRYSDS